jgi:hypothetical protein
MVGELTKTELYAPHKHARRERERERKRERQKYIRLLLHCFKRDEELLKNVKLATFLFQKATQITHI